MAIMKMKIRALNKREKVIAGWTTVVIFAAVAHNFLITPIMKITAQTVREIRKKELLLNRYHRLLDKKEQILSLYDSHKDILEGKDKERDVSAKLFQKIQALSGKSDLALRQVKPLPAEKDSKINRISLDIELEGSLAGIMEFVHNLETSNIFVYIRALRIIPRSDDPSGLRCRIIVSRMFF